MNIRTVLTKSLGACALLVSAVGPAPADQVLYNASGFIVGQQSFSDSFNVNGPGVLTVTLTNMTWPQPLASLNSVISTTQGLVGAEMGAGTETFKLNGGPVYVDWFGVGQGALDAGVYGLNISYQSTQQPGGTTNSVPLPTSIALFLSGLFMLAWQRRVKATAPSASLHTSA